MRQEELSQQVRLQRMPSVGKTIYLEENFFNVEAAVITEIARSQRCCM
jgi:hypothetical protein